MRIWIGGGGTGGHVYPGLAVVEALAAKAQFEDRPAPEILYVGSEEGVERELVQRVGLPFVAVPSGGLHGLGFSQAMPNLVKLVRGCAQAYGLGRRERPAAAFVTGGYASVPVALAAWALGAPVMVYLPDIEPGLAVQFIGRLAKRVAVTVADSAEFFRTSKVVVSGYPVRSELRSVGDCLSRTALGLNPDEPVILVLGGSRGCRSINAALDGILGRMLEIAQIVHVTGKTDWPRVAERRDRMTRAARERYHAFSYLHAEMGSALAAADLVVSRAGASTLGELPAFGLPAVLVPYPHAWRYQRVNADWLVERGAAVRLDDSQLDDGLGPTLERLLRDRPTMAAMAERMSALDRPDAAAKLAATLWALGT